MLIQSLLYLSRLFDFVLLIPFLLQDLNLSTERLTSNKAFTNKLWNAGKFLLQNLPDRSDATAWDVLLANKVSD